LYQSETRIATNLELKIYLNFDALDLGLVYFGRKLGKACYGIKERD